MAAQIERKWQKVEAQYRNPADKDLSHIARIESSAVPMAQEEKPQPVVVAAQTALPAPEQSALAVEAVMPKSALSNYTVSFDCAKAGTAVEKIVCSGSSIGQLDGLLAATYRERLDPQFGADPAIMKAGQREWMQQRNACQDEACVERLYRDRIKELCEMPVVSGAHPGGDCEQI